MKQRSGNIPDDERPQRLVEILEARWASYRRARRRCRQRVTAARLHQLRVEIRRTVSLLELLAPVLPSKPVAAVTAWLRGEFKLLSKLRDAHVHLATLRHDRSGRPELDLLIHALERQEKRRESVVEKKLRRNKPGLISERMRRMRDRMESGLARRSPPAVSGLLTRQVEVAFGRVVAAQRRIAPARPASIHRARVAFKKFRYMVEALAGVRPVGTPHALEAMQSLQREMGAIQDAEQLWQRVEKRSGRKGGKVLRPYCDVLRRRRARLVAAFIPTSSRLLDCWPLPTARARARERKHGTLSVTSRHRR